IKEYNVKLRYPLLADGWFKLKKGSALADPFFYSKLRQPVNLREGWKFYLSCTDQQSESIPQLSEAGIRACMVIIQVL
ncbi:MAG: hypothetical protein KAR47_06095, partial [Planctomycetes bacterium]|nr:hypothetical protein [Planctomycetota bacterium]